MTNNEHFVDASSKKPFGLVAKFTTPHELLEAVKSLRSAGIRALDTYSPFPVHGMDKALGLKPSILPWFVLFGALLGTVTGIVMQAWMNGIDYPIRVGGKPFFSYQAYVPVAFELTVLFGALTTVFGMFGLNRLPQPYHPLFSMSGFSTATDDGFFVSIGAEDPKWDEPYLQSLLKSAGGKEITLVTEDHGASS